MRPVVCLAAAAAAPPPPSRRLPDRPTLNQSAGQGAAHMNDMEEAWKEARGDGG